MDMPTDLSLLDGPNIPRWLSSVDTSSQGFKDNYEAMLSGVEFLNAQLSKSLNQGPPNHCAKHISTGQLLARDRVELLLDEDSPFLELLPLAGWGQKDNPPIGGSVVAGIGLVCGVLCMVSASVPTIKGGAVNKVTLVKGARLSEIAFLNRLPSINLTQSAGADLRQQAKVFHSGGGAFRNLAHRAKAGLPTINIVFGSSTAGGAYSPGMSDYVLMVKKQAKVFLGGPPLVKMATGEETDEESLGGADMHSKISGVSDFLAANELDAMMKARQVMANLNWHSSLDTQFVEPPWYDPDELLGLVESNAQEPIDSREVIARIVDGSRFLQFKPLYGPSLVSCFAKIHNLPIGKFTTPSMDEPTGLKTRTELLIPHSYLAHSHYAKGSCLLSSNGYLSTEALCKAIQFIELCNQREMPILFLHSGTGFAIASGQHLKEGGTMRQEANLFASISNSRVPCISIIMGPSCGAGGCYVCGRTFSPRFSFAWPSPIASAAPASESQKPRGTSPEGGPQWDAFERTSRCGDDGIVDPRQTRDLLALCLSVLHTASPPLLRSTDRGQQFLHRSSRM